ncbi:MAG: hypothetical protein QMD21_02095 [Candidatus Thermoplasmatota archaeon]|nr:hypothetical protein [Candidatus Thermoplasmatota archaeon]
MSKRLKEVIAIIVAVAIITTAYYIWTRIKGYETGIATLDDVLRSSSERRVENMLAIVSDHSPYFTLIATSVALYYEGTELKLSPLLVVNPEDNSRAVVRFLNLYGAEVAVVIGEFEFEANTLVLSSSEREWEEPTTATINVDKYFRGSVKDISLAVASHFWIRSEGVILIESSQEGYNQAIIAMPIASYLNIPVIVTDAVDEKVANVLKGLGVRYSLVCGRMGGYGLTKRFATIEEIQDWIIAVVEQRLASRVSYITMTNPLDIRKPRVLDTHVPEWSPVTFEILHSTAKIPHPGVPPTDLEGQPAWYFNITYKYANVKIDVKMDVSGERYGDDSGARVIAFLGIDANNNGYLDDEDNEIMYFCSSVGYEVMKLEKQPYGYPTLYPFPSEDGEPKVGVSHLYTEAPIFNAVGEYCIQLLARLPSDDDIVPLVNPVGKADCTLSVTVEELDSYIYPRLYSASSLAGYLTAYRKGVVLAKPEFMIWNEKYVEIWHSSTPTTNPELIEPTNERVGEVKAALNNLLGRMAGMPTETDEDIIALSEYYHGLNQNGDFTYLGILAHPDMIPHYYYPSKRLGDDMYAGYGVRGDIIYSDIDADLDLPPYGLNGRYPRLELCDGRITGFDSQDISALLSRTFFYKEIIDNIQVPEGIYNPAAVNKPPMLGNIWKNNALGMSADAGSPKDPAHPPGTEPAQAKVAGAWRKAGMTVDQDNKDNQQCARQEATLAYEGSNFISILVHGFWYWYVPTPRDREFDTPDPRDPFYEIGAGSAFDVRHVKLMNFGPSTMWATSCVTGRLDGLQPYNCISNAFLHAGMNCYVDASTYMWGSLFFTPDPATGEVIGNLMMNHFYGHLCGYLYDKSQGGYVKVEQANTTVGAALMLAKNFFIKDQGTDGGGCNDDTYEAVFVHGDPAFNPYTPNFDG